MPGRPACWMMVAQGPTALTIGAGWACLDVFDLVYLSFFLSSFSPFLGDGPIKTEILF